MTDKLKATLTEWQMLPTRQITGYRTTDFKGIKTSPCVSLDTKTGFLVAKTASGSKYRLEGASQQTIDQAMEIMS